MRSPIASQPPVSLRLCKKLMREAQHMTLPALLEMSAGARINGKMVHQEEPQKQLPKPGEGGPPEAEKA